VVAAPRLRTSADKRVVFVDALRLMAAFQMLQGHTIAALLATPERAGPWFVLWTRLRGLTSVSFLFTSGMAFYFATAPRFAVHRRDRRALGRRALRALGLIALGYALHTPIAALMSGAGRSSALREWLAVDILQCIGASLLWLELVVLCSPGPRAWLGAVVLGTVACWATTAAAYRLGEGSLPAALCAYAGPQLASLFPLWPYAAHMLAGVVCGAVTYGRPDAAGRLALCGVAVVLAALTLGRSFFGPVVFDHMLRLAAVLGLTAVLAHGVRPLRSLPRSLEVLSRQSLFLYVFHVLVVYGRPWGLGAWLGPSLGLPMAIAAAVAVIAVSCTAALGWQRARGSRTLAVAPVVRLPRRSGRVSRPSPHP
jgi:hypothetical protein